MQNLRLHFKDGVLWPLDRVCVKKSGRTIKEETMWWNEQVMGQYHEGRMHTR